MPSVLAVLRLMIALSPIRAGVVATACTQGKRTQKHYALAPHWSNCAFARNAHLASSYVAETIRKHFPELELTARAKRVPLISKKGGEETPGGRPNRLAIYSDTTINQSIERLI
jgi:hypothetical protein